MTPVAPAPRPTAITAPRLRGSVTWSRQHEQRRGSAASSQASAYGYGAHQATTPWWSGEPAASVSSRSFFTCARGPSPSHGSVSAARSPTQSSSTAAAREAPPGPGYDRRRGLGSRRTARARTRPPRRGRPSPQRGSRPGAYRPRRSPPAARAASRRWASFVTSAGRPDGRTEPPRPKTSSPRRRAPSAPWRAKS